MNWSYSLRAWNKSGRGRQGPLGRLEIPFPGSAEAALKDSFFYDLMSAIEIIRMGRSGERKLAVQYLEKRIKA